MKSPFPGMDPYLELTWRDVHHRLCTYGCDMIQEQLGPGLFARIDERLVVDSVFDHVRGIHPDVRVIEKHREPSMSPAAATATKPLVVRIGDSEPAREGFIEIVDSGGKLVTAIEFVSPTNKRPGDGRTKYRRKQREMLGSRTNMVEVDLTRGGKRAMLAPAHMLPSKAHTDYLACVVRGSRPGEFELYPMPLRQTLAIVGIPLRPIDSDIVLNLQQLVDAVYQKGRYLSTIDYRKPCRPKLASEDAVWADALLKAAGLR
jgi:hypothetical protein